jgi:F-type H+-transporting ATPase subunit gamma
MATLREIRRRIVSVKSTQKITKAMKMVAAAKLRRAQDAVISARPYARKMRELFSHLGGLTEIEAHPLFTERPIGGIAIIVVTADRGLCGAFNSNIIKATVNHIRSNYADLNAAGKVKLVCVGKKGADFLQKNNYKVIGKYIGIYQDLNFNNARVIVEEVAKGFLSGEYDKVEIIYNEFKSIMQQRIAVEQLLPIKTDITNPPSQVSVSKYPVNFIYEPSSQEIIKALIPKHINFQLWRALLESNAAEQGARMSAMENATTNASELIRNLQLSYNKARQTSITKELLEIVSGAEALKNG